MEVGQVDDAEAAVAQHGIGDLDLGARGLDPVGLRWKVRVGVADGVETQDAAAGPDDPGRSTQIFLSTGRNFHRRARRQEIQERPRAAPAAA